MSKYKDYLSKNKKIILLQILIITFCLVIFFIPQSEESVFSQKGTVKREDYLGKDKEISVDAQMGGIQLEDFSFIVSHREYSREELQTIFYESHDLIIDHLSDNTGSGSFTKDLEFFSSLPDSPFSFSFFPLDDTLVDLDGRILVPYDFEVSIEVLANYGEFEISEIITLKVEPCEEIQKRCIENKLTEQISLIDSETITREEISLPTKVEGIDVTFSEKEAKKNPLIILVGVAIATLLYIAAENDKKKEKSIRKEAIIREYPLVIQKMVMYMSAGMTVRNAWGRICETVESNQLKGPIYEEMIITENEIRTGVSEGLAYEHFGERIDDNSIIRFTALLSQNIRKGSSNLSLLLYDEYIRAFEKRKQTAIKRGEEAGTKLLFPMMLLLLTVTLIIMVPAFMGL